MVFCSSLYAFTNVLTAVCTLVVSFVTDKLVVVPGLALNKLIVTPCNASVTVFDGLVIVIPSITMVAFRAATVSDIFAAPPVDAS